jgi:hypothetical protein
MVELGLADLSLRYVRRLAETMILHDTATVFLRSETAVLRSSLNCVSPTNALQSKPDQDSGFNRDR